MHSSRTRAAAGLAGDRAAAADGGEPLAQVAETPARRGAIGLSGRRLGAGREALAVVLDGEVEAVGALHEAQPDDLRVRVLDDVVQGFLHRQEQVVANVRAGWCGGRCAGTSRRSWMPASVRYSWANWQM